MKDEEKEINKVLNSCLTGYSIYDDEIIECISKENRSLLRGLTRADWLRLLCDVITMAYADGQSASKAPIEVAAKVIETDNNDDKLEFSNMISRDMYKQMKGMNRRQFTDFLFDLYKRIYEEHEKQSEPDYEKIRNEILKISGVGNVKADKIMEVIKGCAKEDG